MLTLESWGVTKRFEHKKSRMQAQAGIGLDVREGETTSLTHTTGCGKPTFLRLAGLYASDDGQVLFHGKPVSNTDPERTMILQEGALFLWLNVRDSVESRLPASAPAAERTQSPDKYPDMIHPKKFTNSHIPQLPVGMKQGMAKAQALVVRQQMLLIDEPFSALDIPTRNRLSGKAQDIWQNIGKTIMAVAHNAMDVSVLGFRIFGKRPSRIRRTIDVPLRTSGGPEMFRIQAETSTKMRQETT